MFRELNNSQSEDLYLKALMDVLRSAESLVDSHDPLRALMVEHSFDENFASAVLNAITLSVATIDRLERTIPLILENEKQSKAQN